MTVFTIHLQSGTQYEIIENACSFVGEDSSGQFGILANHARMISCLSFGMARFQCKNNETEYLALPGGVLYFVDNQLYINTRHYLRNKDYRAIENALEKELHIEEENIKSIKESLHHLDEEILIHLMALKRQNRYEIK